MKLNKFYLILIPFLMVSLTFAQDNLNSGMSKNQPSAIEKGRGTYFERGPFYSPDLENALKKAQESGNTVEAERIMQEMESRIPDKNKFKTNYYGEQPRPVSKAEVPSTPDWYTNDALVWSGSVKYGDPYFRQIDMKMGEDGNMYLAFNRAPVSGTNGRIDVYRSSNGGANWVYTQGIQYSTGYIGTVSLLVEQRSDSNNPDSIRIFVFYTVSANSNNDNATMSFGSWRRNGSAWYYGNIASPPSGQEFSFVSAVSDGAFYNSATWIAAFCTQSNNALTTTYDFKYYRSINWGQSWTGVTISTSWNDFYPSAELRPGSGPSTDSVWIAVERRFSTTNYEIRIIRTPWSPTASSNTYFVTSGGSNVHYYKPALTVKQNRVCDSAMFTTTRDGFSYYFFTTNGGGWSAQAQLGGTSNGNNKSFTWCASSPTGQNHFMGIWVSSDGDSLNLRRGVLNFLGNNVYKVNSNTASTSISPTCMIYTPNVNTNLSAIGYAGFGPINIYADQEGLLTGITPSGNEIPGSYSLSQNFPNPFNPVTNIEFSIPKPGIVKLVLFDLTGREVAVIADKQLSAGTYTVDFDASKLSSGVYFYKMTSNDFSDVKKMILVK